MLFLLQVGENKISLISLLQKGGWIMYPLYALLVIAIFVFIERLLAIKKAGANDPKFMLVVRDHIVSGNIAGAKSFAKSTDNAVAKMIEKGIMRIGKPLDAIEKSMENVGKLEMYSMERNLNILSLVAGIAPMFGFLGTVIGVITIFHDISNVGKIEIGVVSQGLYIKMISSAAGLVVGMLAYVAYNTLVTRIGRLVNTMESHAVEFVDILDEPMN